METFYDAITFTPINKMKNIRVHLIIKGRVQGVWFRGSTRKKALALGLTGWIKNRPDGTVEAVIEGQEDRVRELVSWCHHGPDGAMVSMVQEKGEEWKGEFDSFNIVY